MASFSISRGKSPSARKVWIEIDTVSCVLKQGTRSPSARKVWIEIDTKRYTIISVKGSPSARKVWIEIVSPDLSGFGIVVTFREEGVD